MKTFLCTLLFVAAVFASEEPTKVKRGVLGAPADWLVHAPPLPAAPVPNPFEAGPWASSFPAPGVPLLGGAPWASRPLAPLSPAHATTALDIVALRKRIELAVAQQRYAAAAAAAASAREIAAVSAAKEAVREAAEQRSHAAKAAAAAAATLSQQAQHIAAGPKAQPWAAAASKPGYGSW